LFAPFNLSGKTCLITGGSRGIGLGMAKALASAGADLMLWADQSSSLASAAQALRDSGTRISTRLVDVTVEEEIVAGMEAFRAEFPRLDSIITCAGVGQRRGYFIDMETDAYRDVFKVNVDGTFWSLREACRQFVRQARAGEPGGSIIGVGSLAGRFGAPTQDAYAASKLAVEGLVRSVAVEMAGFGVRANAVIPGWIETDMTNHFREVPDFSERLMRRLPAKRWGGPGDFGGIAVYLVSDASAYHSGDSIVIDGGYSVC
jgi:NAD(P)-dependent dehydrogenase (short-subunit alcohol dehydrogenase family)